VRSTVRLMGLPTRETNSSHTPFSQDSAQRHTTPCNDKDAYRVGLWVFDIYAALRPNEIDTVARLRTERP